MTDRGLKELVLSVAAGDHNAFRKFYDHFYLKAYRFARVFLADATDCETVIAEVFFIIWEKRELLHNVQNIEAYLCRIIRNESYNYLKKRKKDALVSLDDMPVELSTGTSRVEDMMIEEEMMSSLQRAVNSLPERCKLIFILVREQKLSHKEVAEVLSITPGTVEVQMNIAIKKLKKIVGAHLMR